MSFWVSLFSISKQSENGKAVKSYSRLEVKGSRNTLV